MWQIQLLHITHCETVH